jgi:hypothetical protein
MYYKNGVYIGYQSGKLCPREPRGNGVAILDIRIFIAHPLQYLANQQPMDFQKFCARIFIHQITCSGQKLKLFNIAVKLNICKKLTCKKKEMFSFKP